MIKNKQILELFDNILKPHIQGKGGAKLLFIKKVLEQNNIPYEYNGDIGLIINKQEHPRLVCVSHMDLIPLFNKGLERGKSYKIQKDIIGGALDNTITNTSLLLVHIELIKKGITDVEILLSEGEEIGLVGMRNYLKKYNKKSEKTFFVNLDVTNDGKGYDVSVEFDKPNFNIIKQLQKIGNKDKVYFTPNRFCDDTDAILSSGNNGLSLCLPTYNTIHSYQSFTKLSSLENYTNYLLKVLIKLVPPKNYKKEEIKKDQFKRALEVKKFKDIDKKENFNNREEILSCIEKKRHISIIEGLIDVDDYFYTEDYEDTNEFKELILYLHEVGLASNSAGMYRLNI